MTNTETKRQSDIEVGDIIVFLGHPHRVDRIDPPSVATLAIMPSCVGFARSNDGWGITLDGEPYQRLEVL